MIIDVYRSKSDQSKFIAVLAGNNLTKLAITDPYFKIVTPFKLNHSLSEEKQLIGLNTQAAIKGLQDKGFYLFGAGVQYSES